MGRNVKYPNATKVTISMDRSLEQKIKRQASDLNIKVSPFIDSILQDYFSNVNITDGNILTKSMKKLFRRSI